MGREEPRRGRWVGGGWLSRSCTALTTGNSHDFLSSMYNASPTPMWHYRFTLQTKGRMPEQKGAKGCCFIRVVVRDELPCGKGLSPDKAITCFS